MYIQGNEIIMQSAALRGRGQFGEAIKLIEENISAFHPDILLNAWLEAFYAAKESGDTEQAKKYACEIAKEKPDLPSIQNFL